MTMTKMSLAAIAAMSMATCAMAADDLAGMFKEGKLDGRVRAHYFYTDWTDNGTTGKNATDAKGLAVGGSLIYHTGKLNGFSAGIGVYTTQNPTDYTERFWGTTANTSKDLFSRGPGSTYSYGKGYSVLAETYLQYNISKTEAKAGRFLLANPFINPNDTKMIPVAVEGASVVSKEFCKTTIELDYIDKIKERGMDYFGNMADTGDTPTKISAHFSTHYSGTGKQAPSVTIIGVKNNAIDALELQGWYMNWPELIGQAMLEANYKTKAGPVGLAFGARYMQQYDRGAGAIILPKGTATSSSSSPKGDTDNSINTYMYAVRAVASYGDAKLLLAHSHTDKGADLLAPWRAFPTDGYTRSMTQTDWNANTKSYKTQIDYDFNKYVSGVSALLSYSFYDRDPSRKPYESMTDRAFGNGNTRQWNMDVVYKLAGAWKGTELKARLMDQQNSVTAVEPKDTSNREMRLEANYRF